MKIKILHREHSGTAMYHIINAQALDGFRYALLRMAVRKPYRCPIYLDHAYPYAFILSGVASKADSH